MVSETVIQTLRDALHTQPDDMDLRLHLAELLLDADILQEAQSHFHEILKAQPTHIKSLVGSSKISAALGDHEKAQQYNLLIQALSPPTDASSSHNLSNVSNFPENKHPNEHNAENKLSDDDHARLKVVDKEENITVGPWEDFEAPITLDDVGGMQAVKKRLNIAFLAPLKNPEMMKMYGKSLKGGMMLYGPPGCGKTFIARALAGELGAKFMSIGLSDVLDMWLGESERKLHEVFEAARRNAPTVLFFDEIDALGQKRSQLRNSAGRNIVNQLLSEMDSVGSDNKNLFILSATNHPWDVDTALRRPGRFDRVVLVLPPDKEARMSIVQYHLKEKPIQDIDVTAIAEKSNGFSGADLSHLCDSAVEYAMEESLSTGDTRAIMQKDFDQALNDVRPSTLPWFETARNYAMFANEGGVYDDLLTYIREHKL